jgi:phospholipid/cholesterol/gamma-HCH transport system substrate-binding protein
MANQKTKFTVGLFITCGVIIAVLAIIWLGVSRIFEKGRYYATYFDESVQGLAIDSPVKYRGVPVGRVTRISVAPDSKLIEVILKVESVQEIGRDVVAQLSLVGITGSMFIELDRMKKGEPDRSPTLSFPSNYPIIASKPGEISELLQGVDEVLQRIKTLDLAGISDRAKQTLDSINGMIADANMKKISSNLERSLDNMNTILDKNRWEGILSSIEMAGQSLNLVMAKALSNLDRLETTLVKVDGIVADNEPDIRLAVKNLRSALDQANRFFSSGALLVENTDESIYQIQENLQAVVNNISRASQNLNQLIESLQENPSRLIFSKEPVPRELEE